MHNLTALYKNTTINSERGMDITNVSVLTLTVCTPPAHELNLYRTFYNCQILNVVVTLKPKVNVYTEWKSVWWLDSGFNTGELSRGNRTDLHQTKQNHFYFRMWVGCMKRGKAGER